MPKVRAFRLDTSLLSENGGDADTIHKNLESGIFFFNYAKTDMNIPIGTYGILQHSQRLSGSNVTDSQIIIQVAYTNNLKYSRTGVGNGTGIIWGSWEKS